MPRLVTRRQRAVPQKQDINVFCAGLQGSGKTAFIRRLTDEKQPLETGGPTTEYCETKLDASRFPKYAVNMMEVGGCKEARKSWSKYATRAHSLVLVMDLTEPELMEDAMNEFKRLLRKTFVRSKPVLVIGNKAEKAKKLYRKNWEFEMWVNLHLQDMGFSYKTLLASCDTKKFRIKRKLKQNPGKGLQWLVSAVDKKFDVIHQAIQAKHQSQKQDAISKLHETGVIRELMGVNKKKETFLKELADSLTEVQAKPYGNVENKQDANDATPVEELWPGSAREGFVLPNLEDFNSLSTTQQLAILHKQQEYARETLEEANRIWYSVFKEGPKDLDNSIAKTVASKTSDCTDTEGYDCIYDFDDDEDEDIEMIDLTQCISPQPSETELLSFREEMEMRRRQKLNGNSYSYTKARASFSIDGIDDKPRWAEESATNEQRFGDLISQAKTKTAEEPPLNGYFSMSPIQQIQAAPDMMMGDHSAPADVLDANQGSRGQDIELAGYSGDCGGDGKNKVFTHPPVPLSMIANPGIGDVEEFDIDEFDQMLLEEEIAIAEREYEEEIAALEAKQTQKSRAVPV